jgi:hypothetical protein
VWIDAEGKKYPSDVASPPYAIGALEEILTLVPGE